MKEFMYFWSWLFSPLIGAALFAVLFGVLIAVRRYRDALTVLLSGLSVAGAVYFIKALVGRPRPTVNPHLWADDASFPSGHAAGAAAFAVLAVWMVNGRAKPWVGVAGALLFGLVAASRLYFGVHYPSDVLAGALLGAGLSGIALVVDRNRKMR